MGFFAFGIEKTDEIWYNISMKNVVLSIVGGVLCLLNINKKNRNQIHMISVDDLVPKEHILRDIEKSMNFDFIYDEVKDLYSEHTGRPSIDPVVLFKIVLLQYTFGIRSMR